MYMQILEKLQDMYLDLSKTYKDNGLVFETRNILNDLLDRISDCILERRENPYEVKEMSSIWDLIYRSADEFPEKYDDLDRYISLCLNIMRL